MKELLSRQEVHQLQHIVGACAFNLRVKGKTIQTHIQNQASETLHVVVFGIQDRPPESQLQ